MDTRKLSIEEEILLSAVLNKPREFLIKHPKIRLSSADAKRYKKYHRLLETGYPIPYILGFKWFYGNKIKVTKDVLIPRPETEQVVDLALDVIKKRKPAVIADIGTGSGAIIATLAKRTRLRIPFYASDKSSKALSVAKQNSRSLGVFKKISFLKGDLAKPFFAKYEGRENLLICSNLPYLSKKELSEASIQFEPRLALYGGTTLIERLLKQISKAQIKKSTIILEINYNQAGKIKDLVKKYLPGSRVKMYKDYQKYDRNVVIQI